MRFDIVTIFPRIFDSYLTESLLARARKNRLVEIRVHNLRDFAIGRHRTVDDRPFGGGPGMVIKIEPVYRAVQFLKSKPASGGKNQKLKKRSRIILFSTRGRKLDAKIAKRLSKYDRLILLCGRYEGVDERVAKHIADEEISIGDYVLSGGELPALVLIETVSRFLPGFLGKKESLEEIKGSYPAYTRPEIFKPGSRGSRRKRRRWSVPTVLLTGDHRKIEAWRRRTSSSAPQ